MLIDIVVPVGSTGTVYIPVETKENVTESGKKIKKNNKEIKLLRVENGNAVYSIGSGKYSFLATRGGI